MNIWQLFERIRLQNLGSGNYLVTILYKGKEYTCHSNNSSAYRRVYIIFAIRLRERYYSYTAKQALQSFYDECKRKNNL